MKLSIISFVAALAAVTTASPVPDGKQTSAHITFTGAADGEFTQDFKTDGSSQKITNPLSVSKISAPKGVTCVFLGVDGQVTTVDGWSTVDVGPPQTQVAGTCRIQWQ